MYHDLVQRLTEQLQLKQPPIGLAFIEYIPENIQHTTRGVPSACTFWRLAEQGVFYATPEDHKECPIRSNGKHELVTIRWSIGLWTPNLCDHSTYYANEPDFDELWLRRCPHLYWTYNIRVSPDSTRERVCRVSGTFADNSCSKCGTDPIPSRAKRSLSIDIAINDQYNQFIKRPLGHIRT